MLTKKLTAAEELHERLKRQIHETTLEKELAIAKQMAEKQFFEVKLKSHEKISHTLEKELQCLQERFEIKCTELVQKDTQQIKESINKLLQDELYSLKLHACASVVLSDKIQPTKISKSNDNHPTSVMEKVIM